MTMDTASTSSKRSFAPSVAIVPSICRSISDDGLKNKRRSDDAGLEEPLSTYEIKATRNHETMSKNPVTVSNKASKRRRCGSRPVEWVCDVCKVHAFDTYEEAVAHEQVCVAAVARSSRTEDRDSKLSAALLEGQAALSNIGTPLFNPEQQDPLKAANSLAATASALDLLSPRDQPPALSPLNRSHLLSSVLSELGLASQSRPQIPSMSAQGSSSHRSIHDASSHDLELLLSSSNASSTLLGTNMRSLGLDRSPQLCEFALDRRNSQAPLGSVLSPSLTSAAAALLSGEAARREVSPPVAISSPPPTSKRRLLGLLEDCEALPLLHVIVRRNLEIFACTAEHMVVSSTLPDGCSVPKASSVGQVGIRCAHCSAVPLHHQYWSAVFYPKSIESLMSAALEMASFHFTVCENIPMREKVQYAALVKNGEVGGSLVDNTYRIYWMETAEKLGLRDSGDARVLFDTDKEFRRLALERMPPAKSSPASESVPLPPPTETCTSSLVRPEDKMLVCDFYYYLYQQVEPCGMTESDKSRKRKSDPIGFPGIRCRFCQGKKGWGRYFPSSAVYLRNTNRTQAIFCHIMKCDDCPMTLKTQLMLLKKNFDESGGKNKYGLLVLFFNRIWDRIHLADQEMRKSIDGADDESEQARERDESSAG